MMKFLFFLVLVVSFLMVLGACVEVPRRQIVKKREQKEIVPRGTSRNPGTFQSYSICPDCDSFDLHDVDIPKPDFLNFKMTEQGWKFRPRTTQHGLCPVGDHPEANVIRKCKRCGSSWGEK